MFLQVDLSSIGSWVSRRWESSTSRTSRMDGPVYRTWRRQSVWKSTFWRRKSVITPFLFPKAEPLGCKAQWGSAALLTPTKLKSVGGVCLTSWSGWIRLLLLPIAADFHKHKHTHTHTNISINSLHVTLTPRLVNMVAIFVAAASAAASAAANKNNNKNKYSGKLKWKTATTSLLKTVFQIHSKMGNDTNAKLKGHLGVATHSLEPCKFPCQAEQETQHKLHRNYIAGTSLHLLDWSLSSVKQWQCFLYWWTFFSPNLEFRQNGDFNHWSKFARFPRFYFFSNHQIFYISIIISIFRF